jgi:hypothetical protein
MNGRPKQQLLPPESQAKSSAAGWFDWLFDPEPARFLLPATGLWILGLDWLLFPKEALLISIPLTSVLGFLGGSLGAYHIQRRFAQDQPSLAMLKSLLAGFLVGVPFPLAGTLVAGWILASSGLADWKRRMWGQSSARK